MPRFRPEPEGLSAFSESSAVARTPSPAARVGVLWCNLGSPQAPTAAAVRPFLAEFLSDPRVVEIPRALWALILHGLILRTRPARSAAKYERIWTPDGSPLTVWTRKQATLLRGWLGERGHRVMVRHAFRYGQPSVASQLDAFKAEGVARVLVMPAYPQYSATTTASVIDAVNQWSRDIRHLPEFRFVNSYHDEPPYIEALARSLITHWQHHGRPDRLVMSFHGLPERNARLGDPYRAQCERTASLLAERVQLPASAWQIAFQSRFGRAKWLAPSTDATLRKLGAAGVRRVDVLCPGFAADCLETLEEIALEGRTAFMEAGGKEFNYVPALNDSAAGITALAELAQKHLAGWPTQVK